MSTMPDTYIAWFEDLRLASRPTVGGKGASLGELTYAGIRVPSGFVVTTNAFEVSLAVLDHDGAIRRAVSGLDHKDLARVTTVSEGIRTRVQQAPLPAPIESAITGALRRVPEVLASVEEGG